MFPIDHKIVDFCLLFLVYMKNRQFNKHGERKCQIRYYKFFFPQEEYNIFFSIAFYKRMVIQVELSN